MPNTKDSDMQTLLERTLLYAVALATVGMLLFSRSPDQEAPVAAPAVDAREAISLREDQGNERIRLAVEDGEPAIVEFGLPTVGRRRTFIGHGSGSFSSGGDTQHPAGSASVTAWLTR